MVWLAGLVYPRKLELRAFSSQLFPQGVQISGRPDWRIEVSVERNWHREGSHANTWKRCWTFWKLDSCFFHGKPKSLLESWMAITSTAQGKFKKAHGFWEGLQNIEPQSICFGSRKTWQHKYNSSEVTITGPSPMFAEVFHRYHYHWMFLFARTSGAYMQMFHCIT